MCNSLQKTGVISKCVDEQASKSTIGYCTYVYRFISNAALSEKIVISSLLRGDEWHEDDVYQVCKTFNAENESVCLLDFSVTAINRFEKRARDVLQLRVHGTTFPSQQCRKYSSRWRIICLFLILA